MCTNKCCTNNEKIIFKLEFVGPALHICLERESPRTGEHHLNQVAFLDVVRGGQTLQDVVCVQVMAEEQDLVVHPEKSTFRELKRKRRGAVNLVGSE